MKVLRVLLSSEFPKYVLNLIPLCARCLAFTDRTPLVFGRGEPATWGDNEETETLGQLKDQPL